MIISVDNNLTEIKKSLINQGYEVYNLSDRIISDVYVYSEDRTGLINVYKSVEANSMGSLLIDAHGKSLNEIMYAIRNRVYSPLF